jgi:hypothetical protein
MYNFVRIVLNSTLTNDFMKKFIYIFVLIVSSCYSQQSNKKYLIGEEINNESGFLLEKDGFDYTFGIAFSHSETQTFLLFFKIENTKKIIIDILAIDKKDLSGNKLTEYCYSKKGADSELIAIVEESNSDSEFYTKILKAWRANRKSEKFEKIKPKKILKCNNESYGI